MKIGTIVLSFARSYSSLLTPAVLLIGGGAATMTSAQVTNPVPVVHAGGTARDALPANARSLPPLPLPAGAKVMAFCDSHSAFNNVAASAGVLAAPATAKGLVEAAWSIDPRFNFDSWYDSEDPWRRATAGSIGAMNINGANQGIPSDHLLNGSVSAGAMTRLRYALSREPALMIVNCGTNSLSTGDIPGGMTPATAGDVISQLNMLVEQNSSHGVWTVLSTLYPRSDWPVGDQRHESTRIVNDWIRAQAGRTGVAAILDPYEDLVSPTNADGIRASLFLDPVHLNAAGVNLVATQHLSPILNAIIAPASVFDQDPANANLWPSATYAMSGSAGSRTGAATTGSVASGFNLFMARSGGGSTQVAAKEAGGGALSRQIVTVIPGSTPAWDQSRLTFPALTSNLPQAGQWLRAYVRMEATEARSAVPLLTVSLLDAGGATIVQAQAGTIDSAQYASAAYGIYAASGRGVFWLATKPFMVPSGTTVSQITTTLTLNFWTGAYPSGSSFTIKADSPILRVSGDPRTAWKLP